MTDTELFEDFLSVINHRMRTPIRANALAAKLMAEGSFGAVTDKQLEILHHVIDNNESVDRLCGMLVDIFNYKSANKHLSKTECQLEVLVGRCVQKATLNEASRGKVVSVESAPATVFGDPEELSKLIQHLIDNGTKYARHRLQVRSGIDAECRAFVTVADDGQGIAPEDIANLFSRFYQRSAEGKYAPATGVGLCLCSEIIKAHGGTIGCRSLPGQRTEFTISMPPAAGTFPA